MNSIYFLIGRKLKPEPCLKQCCSSAYMADFSTAFKHMNLFLGATGFFTGDPENRESNNIYKL